MKNNCERWWGYKHQWENWEIIEAQNILRSSDKAAVGVVILQARVCGACNYKQVDIQNRSL